MKMFIHRHVFLRSRFDPGYDLIFFFLLCFAFFLYFSSCPDLFILLLVFGREGEKYALVGERHGCFIYHIWTREGLCLSQIHMLLFGAWIVCLVAVIIRPFLFLHYYILHDASFRSLPSDFVCSYITSPGSLPKPCYPPASLHCLKLQCRDLPLPFAAHALL